MELRPPPDSPTVLGSDGWDVFQHLPDQGNAIIGSDWQDYGSPSASRVLTFGSTEPRFNSSALPPAVGTSQFLHCASDLCGEAAMLKASPVKRTHVACGLPGCSQNRDGLNQLTSVEIEPILRAVHARLRKRIAGGWRSGNAEIAAPMVKGEIWRLVGESLSRWSGGRWLLGGVFEIEDEHSVSEFLRQHEGVLRALIDFISAIRRVAPTEDKPRLRVVIHHDDVDEREMQVLVPLNLNVAAAATVIEELESTWWMNLPQDIRKLVGADAVYV